ncbi:MAG TPA: hypothetical protein VF626_08250 [Chthoniobacterales bacterium]|jgi:hypothetical protein
MIAIKRELTPSELYCGLGPACPALFELEDGSFLVVGRKVENSELPETMRGRISADERGIVVPRALLKSEEK